MDSGAELLIDFRESSWDIEKPLVQKPVDVNKKETYHGLNDSFILNCSNAQSSNLGLCLLPHQKLHCSPLCGTLIDLSFSGVNATESSPPLENSKQEIAEIEVLSNDSPKFAEQIINCEQKLKDQSSNLPSYRVKKEKNSDMKTSTSSGSSKSEATSSWSPSAIYDDVELLENEIFDFNVSISPSFRLGDDDVFNSQSNSNNNEACRCNCNTKNPKLSTPQKHTLFPQTFTSEISQEATKIFYSLSPPNEKPINLTVGALQLSLSPSEFDKCSSPTETIPCQQIELLDQNVCSISNQISFQQPNSKTEISLSPLSNNGGVKCNSCNLKIESENQKYTVDDENKHQRDYDISFNKSGCDSMLEMQSMRETGICNTVNERESDMKSSDQNQSDGSEKNVTSTNSVAKVEKQDEAEIKSCVTVGDENKENFNHMHQAPNTENGTNQLQHHYRSSNSNNTSLTNQSQSPLIRRETFTVKPSPNVSKPLKEFNTNAARKSTSHAMESSKMHKQFKNNSNSEIKIANEQHAASDGERCAFNSSKKLCKSIFNSSKSQLPRKETFTLKSSPSVVDKIRQKCKTLSLESSHSTPIRSVNRKPSSASEIEKFTSPRIVPKPRLGSQENTATIKSTYGINNRGIASSKVAVQSNTRPLKKPNNSRLLGSSLSSQGPSVLVRSSISSDSFTFQSPSQSQSNSLQLLNSPTLSETGSNRKSFNVLHKANEKMKPTGASDTISKSLQLKKAVPVKAIVPVSKMTKPSSAVKSSNTTSYGPTIKAQGLNVSLPSEVKTVYIKSTSLSATPSKQRNSSLSTPKCTSTPTNIKILSQSTAQNTPASVNKSASLKRLSFVPTPKRSFQKRYSEKF